MSKVFNVRGHWENEPDEEKNVVIVECEWDEDLIPEEVDQKIFFYGISEYSLAKGFQEIDEFDVVGYEIAGTMKEVFGIDI